MYPSKTTPERIADGLVHAIGLGGFVLACGFLVAMSARVGNAALFGATIIYALAILFSISISFAYHLLPRHDLRLIFRRWDHAAIYLVIAGTFSPLLIISGGWIADGLLALIWACALIGVGFKLFANKIDSRWSLASYLGLGWMALLALPSFWSSLPGASTAGIAMGGLFYTIGTLFYRNKTMRYRYPIWHAFGTLGGLSFFVAIWLAIATLAN